jgi:hypothetical protein
MQILWRLYYRFNLSNIHTAAYIYIYIYILGIISVDFDVTYQLLISLSVFVRY